MLAAIKWLLNLWSNLLILLINIPGMPGATASSYASPALRYDCIAVQHTERLTAIFVCRRAPKLSCGARQGVIFELLAQHRFLNLAGRGVRNLAHKSDIVRHPPFGDLALEEGQNFLFARLL